MHLSTGNKFMDMEKRLMVAKQEMEGERWTGNLWLIDANYCIWSGKKYIAQGTIPSHL